MEVFGNINDWFMFFVYFVFIMGIVGNVFINGFFRVI